MARGPRGVRSFQWPVYDPRQLAGGWSFHAPPAGQFGHVSLFNNANDGSWLYVLDVSGSMSAGAGIIFEIVYGNQSFTIDSAAGGLLVSGEKAPWGQIGTFATAACLGGHLGGTGNLGSVPSTMNNRYPLGIIGPGYSFVVEGAAASQTVVAAIWWYVGGSP